MTSTTPIDPQKSQARQVSAWRNLSALKSKMWWRNALGCSIAFAPLCAVPAALFTVALICSIYANSLMVLPSQQIDFNVLIPRLIAAFITFIVTLVLIVVALSKWIVALSAYARVFYSLPAAELTTRSITRGEFDQARVQALEEVKKRKAFLFKYWLIISAVIVMPFFVANIAIAFCLMAQGGLLNPYGINVPASVATTVIATSTVVCVYVTVVSLIALIVAANSAQSAAQAAASTLRLSITNIVPATVVSLAVMGVNLIITTPQELYFLSNPALMFSTSQNLLLSSLGQIWLGATSILLWTLSVTPICELMRGTFE